MKGVSVHFSYSRLSTWRRCRRKFGFKYHLGYNEPAGTGLLVGRVGHEALRFWYIGQCEPQADNIAIQHVVDESKKLGIETSDQFRLIEALGRYFEWARANEKFEVLATEHHFELRIGAHILHGYIDMIVKTPDGKTYGVEHKFHKQVMLNNLDVDLQVTTYLLGCQEYQLDGVIYNVIRATTGKAAREEPVVRRTVTRTPEHLDQARIDLQTQMDEVAVWSEHPTSLYPNVSFDCGWSCGYQEACTRFSEGGDLTVLMELERGAPVQDDSGDENLPTVWMPEEHI